MAEAVDTPTYTCTQCGADFTGRKRKYCGKRCAWLAAGRRKGKRPLAEQRADEYAKTHRECPECKQMFRITRHDNHSKGPQVHCSVTCRDAESRRRKSIQEEVSVYRRWSVNAKRRERASIASLFAKPCDGCGVQAQGRWITLCDSCRDERARASKRAGRARGKARLRAAVLETFDPIEVLERDRWRCHLCGCKTPKALRGTYDDRAPELDHIIPIAAGGEHSRRNTACACRKCNIAKGARPLGQMRLVA